MKKIGVIINPHARKNLKLKHKAIEQYKKIGGVQADVRITKDLDEVATVIQDFKRMGISYIAISGGDGTLHHVLLQMIKFYKSESMPPIVILKDGTMNVVSKSIKLKGKGDQILFELVKKINIENKVVFTGQQVDVYKYYELFDCFALSSSSEGLSIALLEALSFGLPIITTSNTKEHDVIKNNINGFIVTPSNNINNLAESILKLYLNPKLLSKIKINNIELITSKFSITQTARMYHEQYQILKDLSQ